MDEKIALHMAARRYCMEHIAHGDEWYKTDLRTLPPAGKDAIDRSILHSYLLPEIERVVPADFATLDELRTFLISCSRTTEVPPPTQGRYPDQERTMDNERERFRSYVTSLSPHDLHLVQPLPYRRLLTEREADRLWWRLERRWGPRRDGFWYPLDGVTPPPQTVAFNDEWFALYVPPVLLRQILARRGVKRIWQLTTWGHQYEMDLALLFSSYRQTEGYWMADKWEWVLHQSHEQSLTVAGDRLLNPIKKAWPQWNEHLYTGWD